MTQHSVNIDGQEVFFHESGAVFVNGTQVVMASATHADLLDLLYRAIVEVKGHDKDKEDPNRFNLEMTVAAPREILTTIHGIAFARVHDESKCAGEVCFVHSPTAHHMISLPLHYRADRKIWERICEHGVGHPDPDQFPFWEKTGREYEAVHGCDSCCIASTGAVQ